MTRTITLATLRKVARAEEAMIRAAMPRTSDADAAPLSSPILPAPGEAARRTWRAGSLVARGAFTLAEVARA